MLSVINSPLRRSRVISRLNSRRREADYPRLATLTCVLDRVKRRPVQIPGHHYELRYSVIATVMEGYTDDLKRRGKWSCLGRRKTGEKKAGGLPVYQYEYGAVLTHDEWYEISGWMDMYPDSTPTGGMLGAPGLDGWVPAISFQGDESSAYVFPFVVSVPNGKKRLKSDTAFVLTDWDKMMKITMERFAA